MIEFDATGKGVDDFGIEVSDIRLGREDCVKVELEYWIHTQNAAFNPDVILYLTPEQTVELYEKLGQYILDRQIKRETA